MLQNFGRQHPNLSEAVGLNEGVGPRTIVSRSKKCCSARPRSRCWFCSPRLLSSCSSLARMLPTFCSRARLRARREIAVRVSLGATPRRVARQLLTESVLLSFIGAIVGVGLAAVGIRMLDKLPITRHRADGRSEFELAACSLLLPGSTIFTGSAVWIHAGVARVRDGNRRRAARRRARNRFHTGD